MIEGIHIKRKVEKPSLVIRYGTIGVAIKLGKLIYIVPDGLIIGVKNVCAIFVNMNFVLGLREDVSASMCAFFDDEDLFAAFFKLVSAG